MSGDVHVDWHMTADEWTQLCGALATSDAPYIRRLRAAGKIPAASQVSDAQAVPPPAGAIKALLRRAISDPGSVAGPRRYEVLGDASDYESVSEWQTRAVELTAVPAIVAQAAAARQKAVARLARRRADEYESEPEAQFDVYCYEAIALRKFADLLDGDTDGQ